MMGGGSATGLTDIVTMMKNGVQQLSSIAQSLTALAKSANTTASSASPFASLTTVSASQVPTGADDGGDSETLVVLGYFQTTLSDGTSVLVPYYRSPI